MLPLIWIVLCIAAASMLLLPFALRRREIYRRYSGARLVACPENQQAAAVDIDLRRAVDTSIDGTPEVRLCDCTRWPERAHCKQACLAQAVQAEAGERAEPALKRKRIYHLPIALAAFAAWVLGAIWHSHWLFRARWIDAVGLTRGEVKQMGWWYSPHLLTASMCLLFAYGVAWLLAVAHRRGLLAGVYMAFLLYLALAAASGYAIAKLPQELLAIEAGYITLATLTVGAVVGGLHNRLVLRG